MLIVLFALSLSEDQDQLVYEFINDCKAKGDDDGSCSFQAFNIFGVIPETKRSPFDRNILSNRSDSLHSEHRDGPGRRNDENPVTKFCPYRNTYLKDGVCACINGYESHDTNKGCWKCGRCQKNSHCAADGFCMCDELYELDRGTNQCIPIVPLIQTASISEATSQIDIVINEIRTPVGTRAFCDFTKYIATGRVTSPNRVVCPVKHVPLIFYRFKVSFNAVNWSSAEYLWKKTPMHYVSIPNLAVFSAVLVLTVLSA